jgi:hypothetical protein
MRIFNTDDQMIGYIPVDLSDGENKTFVLRIIPADGFFLKATPGDDDVTISARENGTADPFIDINDSPIDLSAYTPEIPVDFDIKVAAGLPLNGIRRFVLNIAVSMSSAAGWVT